MQKSAAYSSSTTRDSSILDEMRQDVLYLMALALGTLGFIFMSGTGLGQSAFHGGAEGGLLLTTALAAYAVANRSYLTAGWLAIAGSTATVLLALYWYPSCSIAALLVIPTGMATFLSGARSGLLLALAATVMILRSGELFMPPGDGALLATLILIWAGTALVWLALRTTREAIAWIWGHYERAYRLLKEAREQCLILKETEKDLGSAQKQST